MADPRSSEPATRRIAGFCALCRSRCGCISVVEDGRLVAVEPDLAHPTGRHLCAKGRAAPELVHNPARLTAPLRRTRPKGDPDPGWQEIGWDEALDLTAGKLQHIAEAQGPEAVAFAVTTPSGTAISDHIDWIERLIRAFGSPNWIYGTEICNWHKDHGTAFTFGSGTGTPDFAAAGCLMLWGHNPSTSWLAQATAVAEAKARGAKLVVVDPRRIGLANKADQWLQVRPGTDGALALGLAGVMIEAGWFDRDFVTDWTNGPYLVRGDNGRFLRAGDLGLAEGPERFVVWDETVGGPLASSGPGPLAGRPALAGSFEIVTGDGAVACRPAFALYRALTEAYGAERVEAITGVPADQIRSTAQLIWENRPFSSYAWTGVGQHTNATQTDRAMSLVAALTGCIDAPGGNLALASPAVNDITGKAFTTAAQKAKTLGVTARPLGPPRDGWITTRDFYRAVLEGKPYPVKALMGFGSNLLVAQPGTADGKAALAALDWHVQLDLFLTPTAAMADLVLPVTSPWEHEALRVGFGVTQAGQSLVQLRPAVVAPRGQARPDSEIVFELARRLGLGDAFFDGDREAGLAYHLAPSGLTPAALRDAPQGRQLDLETQYRKYALASEGRPRGFATPTGRVEIYSEQLLEIGQAPLPDYREPETSARSRPELAKSYPLTLTSAKSALFCHSQHRSLPSLRRKQPDPIAELHPDTAAPLGIGERDWIRIDTPVGSIRVRARLTKTVAPSVVCAQHGWWQGCAELGLSDSPVDGPETANLNHLIDNRAGDPISGSLPLRSSLCRVALANS